jgi:outer membrane lipoprotein-sorting protein
MKSIFSMLAAIAVSASVFAQSADEVIGKHIEAIGGKDNWMKINTMKSEAMLNVQGADVSLTMYQVHNKANKQQISVMNMEGYTIITQEAGWSFMPFMGQTAPEAMTADQLALSKEDLDIQGELLDYKAKGHTAEFLGKEDVDGTDCFKLKFIRKSGSESSYLIDAKTYYILRRVSKIKANGQESDLIVNFSNYQKLPEGIVIPMTMENSMLPAPITFSKVEVNPTIDNAIFEVKK